MGVNALQEALRHFPERLLFIYTLKTSSKTQSRKSNLLTQLSALKLPTKQLSKAQLDDLCNSTSHQGFVAELKPKPSVHIKDFLNQDKTSSLVLALDSINDPQNLGAILRASECFGVDLVVWSKNRGAQLSPVVRKVSSGASELTPTCLVSNLSSSLDLFIQNGYEVVTAEISKEAQTLYEYSFSDKTVLVLGSEGEGVRPIISKKADAQVYIPMQGQVDSLNVSQATSVFLSHIRASIS